MIAVASTISRFRKRTTPLGACAAGWAVEPEGVRPGDYIETKLEWRGTAEPGSAREGERT